MASVAPPAERTAGAVPAGGEPSARFRPDIDGLRAIAVLLVILFHAEVPGFAGGFVGVDVFFVISGFLITGGLLAEKERSGRIDVVQFWLKRARRLLPAAGVMISVVVVAQLLLRSPLVWDDVIEEGFAAATYWSNEQVAGISGGYFGARVESRALLHTWSLSVEEQFYLLWPLVFGAVFALFASSRQRAVACISLIGFLSAVWCASLTAQAVPSAYFAASSRAWEFLAGGMLALGWTGLQSHRHRRGNWPAVLGGTGLCLVLVAGSWFGRGQSFPWPWALVPVVGTGLLLVAQPNQSQRLGRALAARPVQRLGKLSYSWYLWHWPVLVLGREALDTESWMVGLALVIGSLGLAQLSYRFVETPFRHRRSETRLGEVFAAFVLPAGLVLCVVLGAAGYREMVFADPFVASVEEAADGWPEHLGGCYSTSVPGFDERCTFGAVDGQQTVLVLGDSHAAHWMPAFDALGTSNDLKVVALQVGACPLFRADAAVGEDPAACERLRADLPAALEDLSPDLVITSTSEVYVDRATDDVARWRDGHEAFAASLAVQNIGLLVLHDIGRWDSNPLECLIDNRDGDCGMDRALITAHREPVATAEREALAAAGHGQTFDPLDLVCGDNSCEPMEVDGTIIMQDSHHVTRKYAASLGSGFEAAVLTALGSSGE